MSSSPTENLKLKEATFYIVSKCGEKKTFGLKVLHKLLYFADTNHYKKHYKSITGANYIRLVYGPFVSHLSDVTLVSLYDEKIIQQEDAPLAKDITQKRFKRVGDLKISSLSPEEIKVLDNVCDKLGSLNGAQIEELSHMDMPWQVTSEGEFIDLGLVFYRDDALAAKVE